MKQTPKYVAMKWLHHRSDPSQPAARDWGGAAITDPLPETTDLNLNRSIPLPGL
jgi:hypothetical protein